MGFCLHGRMRCDGDDFAHGPMVLFVSRIVEGTHDYCLLETGQYGFAAERALTTRASELKAVKKALRLPGKKRKKETRYFFNNARVLARIAKEDEARLDDDVVAVLFRDCDGTASAGRGLWDDKFRSMLDGFAEERFTRGVPMLPKPKSEAWLLCALKRDYSKCESLEDRSGNDASPNSLKRELADSLGKSPSRESLCQVMSEANIDLDRIQMPSFLAFRKRLIEVLREQNNASNLSG